MTVFVAVTKAGEITLTDAACEAAGAFSAVPDAVTVNGPAMLGAVIVMLRVTVAPPAIDAIVQTPVALLKLPLLGVEAVMVAAGKRTADSDTFNNVSTPVFFTVMLNVDAPPASTGLAVARTFVTASAVCAATVIVLLALSLTELVSTWSPEIADIMVMLPLPDTVATMLMEVVCALVKAPTVHTPVPEL